MFPPLVARTKVKVVKFKFFAFLPFWSQKLKMEGKKIKNFVLDVDGVMTTGHAVYTSEGKHIKIFGPDDHDALNVLRDKLNIFFITADKRGFSISKKRVDEMKFELFLVPLAGRLEWLKSKVDLQETAFMGDGIFDYLLFKEVAYSICPQNGFYKTKQAADFVTKHKGGDRAVAEACVHILERFFGERELKANEKYGVWGKPEESGSK